MEIQGVFLVSAGEHKDDRGTITFFNEFDMTDVKRFYVIEHPNTEVVRAWQGHRHEQKWFHVIAGGFKLGVVSLDKCDQSFDGAHPVIYLLEAFRPTILHVPGGYATGFQALQDYSRMVVYSNVSVEGSQNDDYRFDKHLWSEIWT